jgi:O-antigen ligase
MTTLPLLSRRPANWLGATATALAIAAIAGLAGLGFASLVGFAGPSVAPALLVGIPVAGILAVWSLGRPLVGVVLVFLALPVGLVSLPGGGLQVGQAIAVAATGALLLGRLAAGRPPLPWFTQLAPAVGVLVLALLATPSAMDTSLALKQLANLGGAMLLCVTVVGAVRTWSDVHAVVRALLVAGVLISAHAIPSAGQTRTRFGGALSKAPKGIFGEHNQLGSFSAVVALVAVGVLLGSTTWRRRALPLLATLLSVGALLISLSRGAWIGFLVGGLFLIIVLPRARRALLVAGIPLLIGAAAFGAFAPDRPELAIVADRLESLGSAQQSAYDDRPSVWREAIAETLADVWSGQGPGNFPVTSARAGSGTSTIAADHAHNVLLTVSVEAGIAAALAVLVFTLAVARTAKRLVRRVPPAEQALAAGVGAALASFLGQGLVDFVLRNSILMLLIWALVGLVYAMDRLAPGGSAAAQLDPGRDPGDRAAVPPVGVGRR